MAWEDPSSDGHRGILQQHLVIELDATGHRGSSMAWEHSTSDFHRGRSMAWVDPTSDGHHGIQQQISIELDGFGGSHE